jgi:hypothetical protein
MFENSIGGSASSSIRSLKLEAEAAYRPPPLGKVQRHRSDFAIGVERIQIVERGGPQNASGH